MDKPGVSPDLRPREIRPGVWVCADHNEVARVAGKVYGFAGRKATQLTFAIGLTPAAQPEVDGRVLRSRTVVRNPLRRVM